MKWNQTHGSLESAAADPAPRMLAVLAVLSSVTYLAGFPLCTHFIRGGEMFGYFLAVPIVLVSWLKGVRGGLLSTAGGVAYTNGVVWIEYSLLRHAPPTLGQMLNITFLDIFAFLLVAVVVKWRRDRSQKEIAESSLRVSLAELEAVLKAIPVQVIALDQAGRVRNALALQNDFWTDSELPQPGASLALLLAPDISLRAMSAISQADETGRSASFRFSRSHKGTMGWYELLCTRIDGGATADHHLLAVIRDVTEQKNVEEQLAQSQRLEAVGRLAGGVAHDFNNILQAITGYAESALEKKIPAVQADLQTIKESAFKAGKLARQLLAFSRKQLLVPKVVDVAMLARETMEVLRRVLGENIAVTYEFDGAPQHIRADPTQLGQVIANLAINARDAMPRGGLIGIRVGRIAMAAEDPHRPGEMSPGEYVLMEMTDTGTGIDEETLGHLFEPFFTTKSLGRGTGLGLSIVYGVVKQTGGYIYVKSRIGHGTTFSIYFPKDTAVEEPPGVPPEVHPGGTETILVVEDEPDVRRVICQHLANLGYRVLEAGDGNTAKRICRQCAGQIHLLLTDFLLPDITGVDVMPEFLRANPDQQVVLMTGNRDRVEQVESAHLKNVTVLDKPFSMSALAQQIRLTLDGLHAGPADPAAGEQPPTARSVSAQA